jgi:hypothetical protein
MLNWISDTRHAVAEDGTVYIINRKEWKPNDDVIVYYQLSVKDWGRGRRRHVMSYDSLDEAQAKAQRMAEQFHRVSS